MDFVDSIHPDIIINTTAFHDTEGCENESKRAEEVNSIAVEKLASYCMEKEIILIHISTDWVFDGQSTSPYVESSIASAINSYGKSKLSGEEAVRRIHELHYIVRISSVFGEMGVGGTKSNFVYSMLNLSRDNAEIRVVDDIIMSPTYTMDAARQIWSILIEGRDFGTYHVNNSGQCSWSEFAQAIMEYAGKKTRIIPISHLEYPTIATRPMFSAMGSEKGTLGRPWEEALEEFLGLVC